MDSLTHTLTGAVIAKAIDDKKIGKWGTIAGLTVGFFPDADFVLGLFNQQFYLEYHRDFTHSLLLIPFYSLFFSWVFVKISKRPHFWSYYKICLPVLVSHVIFDLLTSYGTMILSPFFEHRYSWDLVFIIDFVFSGIVFIPFMVSFFWKKKTQWICRGSLVGLTLYVLFCWIQHQQAMDLGKSFAKDLNEEVVQIASLPQPFSPYRWANFVETQDKVYHGFLDLTLKDPPRPPKGQAESGSNFFISIQKLKGLYQPPGNVHYQSYPKLKDSHWVEKALATEGVQFYYWFARFPVVKSVNSMEGIHRVEFMDVRFLLPGIRAPFIYFVEYDDSGRIQSEGYII